MVKKQSKIIKCLLILATCTLAACNNQSGNIKSTLTAQTQYGAVKGVERNGAIEFRGIPYAAAPEGDLRWAMPEQPKAWEGVRDASAFGNACPQQARFNLTDASTTEDCLNLNVSIPADIRDGEKLPVLFWIHGGAFVGGSSNLYRNDKLANKGRLIVVTPNYRLGVLGFMPHPAFANANQLNGNYGLEDQRAALKWVQNNIVAFGGDANNVTIAGESAGAASICMHLASPEKVTGLFHKAIMTSAGCLAHLKTVDVAEKTGVAISDALGCKGDNASVLACMRSKDQASVEKILAVQGAYADKNPLDLIPFAPVVGSEQYPNATIPRSVKTALDSGQFKAVPLMVGGMANEIRLYVGYWWQNWKAGKGPALNSETFNSWLASFYTKDQVQAIAGRYTPAEGWSAENAVPSVLGSILSDYNPAIGINNCLYMQTTNSILATAAKHALAIPVYQFEFSEPDSLVNGVGIAEPYPDFKLGAVHSSIINFIFPRYSNTKQINAPELSKASEKLGDDIVNYWASFAYKGQPAAQGLPAWQPYTSGAKPAVLNMSAANVYMYDAETSHSCKFWKSLYPGNLDKIPN
jgi:para-nitrobenzyl esterase